MAQVFKPSANTYARLSIFGALFVVVGGLYALAAFNRSDYMTQARVAREQPVPFSHRHHAGELGIDCRYCHTSVERSAFAGIPATEICMNCHAQIWSQSDMLEPVRESFRSDRSLQWTRVHDLPDFAYFAHASHVNRGVGCSTCHGRVDRMPLMAQASSLQMEWCLDCHRHPERNVRPHSEVFNMDWEAADQATLGPRLVKEHGIARRDDCTVCHR